MIQVLNFEQVIIKGDFYENQVLSILSDSNVFFGQDSDQWDWQIASEFLQCRS